MDLSHTLPLSMPLLALNCDYAWYKVDAVSISLTFFGYCLAMELFVCDSLSPITFNIQSVIEQLAM